MFYFLFKSTTLSKQLSFYFISFTFTEMPQSFFPQISDEYLKACRTSAIELFFFVAKMVTGFYVLTIFAERFCQFSTELF